MQVHPDDSCAASQSRQDRDVAHPGGRAGRENRRWIPRADDNGGCVRRRSRAKSNATGMARGAPGDTFFIPAGTVHAIGAGLTLCEIQQHSDVTYRLYDYGRPRELHLDEGTRVSKLGPHAARQSAREGVLVSCPFFTTEKVRVDGTVSCNASMIVLLEGNLEIDGQPARAGEAWRAEAGAIELTGNGTVLLTR